MGERTPDHVKGEVFDMLHENAGLRAENERLRAMLDWCDKMEPGIKRRAQIAVEQNASGSDGKN